MSNTEQQQQFLATLQNVLQLVQNQEGPGAIAASQNLLPLFTELLQITDLEANYQIRASFTEVHRLLRLLQRDLAFWKMSKSGDNTRLLATLGSIADFCQLWV
jgi:hypothetical protein